MDVSSERAVLTRLEDKFGQRQHHEGVAIRAHVAAYIADFVEKLEAQPAASIAIPSGITGLRRRYLEAVNANAIAKLRHARARAVAQGATPNRDDNTEARSTGLLSAHLDDLAKQRQHSDLNNIEHHACDLRRISKATKASSSPPTKEGDFLSHAEPQADYDEMARDAQEKLRLLESAVLQARSGSDLEKAQLASVQGTNVSKGVINGEQLRALGEVRAELTAWLEDILANCSTGDKPSELTDTHQEEEQHVALEDVQAAYDAYVKTRKSLLHALRRRDTLGSSLKASIVSVPSESSARAMLPGVDDPMMKQEEVACFLQSKEDLEQVVSYMDGTAKEEKSETAAMLQRLADESQLLPGYPILARSDKFGAAIQAFGGMGADQMHDQVMERTASWAFAAAGAGETTTVAVTKELEQGHEAMEGVQDILKALSFLDSAAAGP